jgi:hypothetical protein
MALEAACLAMAAPRAGASAACCEVPAGAPHSISNWFTNICHCAPIRAKKTDADLAMSGKAGTSKRAGEDVSKQAKKVKGAEVRAIARSLSSCR